MPVGSPRPNAGRPKGARNVKTIEQVDRIEASGLTPLDFMLSVLRDATQEQAIRLDAANKAAPYVHARLSNVEAKIDGDLHHEFSWLA